MQNPLLSKSERVCYTSEVGVEFADPESSGIHGLNVQITQNKGACESIRMRLYAENDLFFLRECVVDKIAFHEMKRDQELTIDFDGLVGVLISFLNKCSGQPHDYSCIMMGDCISFVQFLPHKRIELLRLQCSDACEEAKRAFASYRFKKLQLNLAAIQNKED